MGVRPVTLMALGWLAVASLSGCGAPASTAESQEPVIQVNAYTLTPQELTQELAAVGLATHEGARAPGEEPEWLSRLIERELLVQEAQRLGLDRERAFMGTIERFWKEALIRQLLDRKSREIIAQVHVYEPELEAYHAQLTREGETTEPLAETRDEIEQALRQQKSYAAMEQWIAELRAQAQITVDHDALAELP